MTEIINDLLVTAFEAGPGLQKLEFSCSVALLVSSYYFIATLTVRPSNINLLSESDILYMLILGENLQEYRKKIHPVWSLVTDWKDKNQLIIIKENSP